MSIPIRYSETPAPGANAPVDFRLNGQASLFSSQQAFTQHVSDSSNFTTTSQNNASTTGSSQPRVQFGNRFGNFFERFGEEVAGLFFGVRGGWTNQNALEVKLAKVYLPLTAACVLLYQQQQENRKANGDHNYIGRKLIEAIFSQVIFLYTNVSSIVGSIYAALALGQKPNMLDQAKQLVNILVIGGIGYVSAKFVGAGMFTRGSMEMENRSIRSEFATTEARDKLLNSLRTSSDPNLRQSEGPFRDLFKKLDEIIDIRKAPHSADKKISLITAKNSELLDIKRRLGDLVRELGPDVIERDIADEAIRHKFLGVREVIKGATAISTELFRPINPALAFIVGTSLVGAPLALFVNKKVVEPMLGKHLAKERAPDFSVPSSFSKVVEQSGGNSQYVDNPSLYIPNVGLLQ
jgi:hypothetical protein